jgi:hypothetical protein
MQAIAESIDFWLQQNLEMGFVAARKWRGSGNIIFKV